MKNSASTKIGLVSFGMLLSLNTLASSAQVEIQHLLNFVATTRCEYERNGERYTAKEAEQHIRKKYEYFSDDIKTAEDFIAYAASKSAFSGKYYQVHCREDGPIKSQLWLETELSRYRKQQ